MVHSSDDFLVPAHIHQYFSEIRPIWEAFECKKISTKRRDELLAIYRILINSLPTSH